MRSEYIIHSFELICAKSKNDVKFLLVYLIDSWVNHANGPNTKRLNFLFLDIQLQPYIYCISPDKVCRHVHKVLS
jgi:hypothetical protein